MFENIQLSLLNACLLSILISFSTCYFLVKKRPDFKKENQSQKRLNALNIPPLGGVGMAISFFLSVRLLGEAEDIFIYISFFRNKSNNNGRTSENLGIPSMECFSKV